MTDLTPEELDKERDAEAWRLWRLMDQAPDRPSVVRIALRLARENWQPTSPVDQVLLAVRGIVHGLYVDRPNSAVFAQEVCNGRRDDCAQMISALAAYRAGQSATEERYRELTSATKECLGDTFLSAKTLQGFYGQDVTKILSRIERLKAALREATAEAQDAINEYKGDIHIRDEEIKALRAQLARQAPLVEAAREYAAIDAAWMRADRSTSTARQDAVDLSNKSANAKWELAKAARAFSNQDEAG